MNKYKNKNDNNNDNSTVATREYLSFHFQQTEQNTEKEVFFFVLSFQYSSLKDGRKANVVITFELNIKTE